MKTKVREKEMAIELRISGASIKEIADILKVAPSSVSVWVREIVLTSDQKSVLKARCVRKKTKKEKLAKKKNIRYGRQKFSETYRNRRIQCQEKGRQRVRNEDRDYLAGCSLYWAEGAKNKNTLVFVNSDQAMMKFFIGFIRKYFDISEESIRLTIYCYSGNGLSVGEIKGRWLSILDLKEENITQVRVDKPSKTSKGKAVKDKLPYGMCRIAIGRTDVVQEMFGAIQEYYEFENAKFLGD